MGKGKDKKKRGKIESVKRIDELFEKAGMVASKDKELARRYVKKARRLAMRLNLKMPRELRKKFCRSCYSLFDASSCKRRIKSGFLVLECLNCRNIQRCRLKS